MKTFLDMWLVELERTKGWPLGGYDYLFPTLTKQGKLKMKKMTKQPFVDSLNKWATKIGVVVVANR